MPSPAWERQRGESERAYLAFIAYRDLGADRTVLDAYRQIEGKPGANQASGRWNKWVKEHAWADRAREWDNHLDRQRRKGVEREAVATGARWEQRRLKQVEDDYEFAQLLLKQAKLAASFPIAERRTSPDGLTIFEPTTIRDLRDAAAVAKEAQTMAWAAIREGLPEDEDGFDPDTATPEECAAYLEAQSRRRQARAPRA